MAFAAAANWSGRAPGNRRVSTASTFSRSTMGTSARSASVAGCGAHASGEHGARGHAQRAAPQLVGEHRRRLLREQRRVVRVHDETDFDVRRQADRHAVAPARVVDGRQHAPHVVELGRRPALHVGPHGRTEDADGRKRADGGDALDGFDRLLDGLEARDDLAADGAARQPARAVVHRLEKQALPDRLGLAGADARKPLRIEELETEGEVIDAELDQAVVPREVLLGRQLQADQEPDVLLHRAHIRLGGGEAPAALEAAVEMDERDARLVLRRVAGFDHVLDRLDGAVRSADVAAGGTEAAVEARRVVPECADRIDVDAEIRSLQHADLRHRQVPRRLALVPRWFLRQPHRIARESAVVIDRVSGVRRAAQRVRRPLCKGFDDRRVHPDVALEPRLRRDDDLETRSEPRAGARNAARPLERDVRGHAQAAAEQIDLQLARVETHRCVVGTQAGCPWEMARNGEPLPGSRQDHGLHSPGHMSLPRVVVTGASGFVGRHLVDHLKDDYRIAGIARRSQRRAGLAEDPNVTWLEADIAERAQLDAVFRTIRESGGADYVIHLAAYYDFTGAEHPEYARTNVDGLRNVLDRCVELPIRRFIFASSLAACRFPENGQVLTESSAPDGEHVYARTKRAGEEMLNEYQHAFPSAIVRLAALFSDWCEYPPVFVQLNTWLSTLWNAHLLGGRGLTAIPYLHVHDVSAFFRRVL